MTLEMNNANLEEPIPCFRCGCIIELADAAFFTATCYCDCFSDRCSHGVCKGCEATVEGQTENEEDSWRRRFLMAIFGLKRSATIKDNVVEPVFEIKCKVCGEITGAMKCRSVAKVEMVYESHERIIGS